MKFSSPHPTRFQQYSSLYKLKKKKSIAFKNQLKKSSYKKMSVDNFAKRNSMNSKHKSKSYLLSNSKVKKTPIEPSLFGLLPSDPISIQNSNTKIKNKSKNKKSNFPNMVPSKIINGENSNNNLDIDKNEISKSIHKNTKNKIFGLKYNIIKVIGKGSNSSVYLCEKISNGKKYAVKRVSKMKLMNKREFRNFKVTIF